MTEPCQQGNRFATIESGFAALAKDIREGQRETMELLREIGQQSARIVNIEAAIHDNKKSLNAAFDRIRTLELTPGRMAVKTLMVLSGIAGSIVTGVLVYYLTRGHSA